MTSSCNSEVANTCERFPHRSSTSPRALLSRVVRTSAYESVVTVKFPRVQKILQVPKTQTVQKHSKAKHKLEQYPIVLQKTTKSGLLRSLKICRPTTKDSKQADMEKEQNISNATGHQRDHPVQHIDHEQVCLKRVLQKHSRIVWRVSWSTKLKLRLSFTSKKGSKNQVQTVKNSSEAQQRQAITASKEVAEMQQECRDSVKVQAAEGTRAAENTAWRRKGSTR